MDTSMKVMVKHARKKKQKKCNTYTKPPKKDIDMCVCMCKYIDDKHLHNSIPGKTYRNLL